MTTYTWKDVGNTPDGELSQAEKEIIANRWNAWEAKSAERKLQRVREIRLEKLKETDYLALSDGTLSDAVKTWRQSLRDIPQDYTTEAKYDELLEKKDDGSLKHSVWTKPS